MNGQTDISAIAEQCRDVFSKRVTESAMSQQPWLRSAQGDFNLWCTATKAIGTGKLSLSNCLKEDETAQKAICKLLLALTDSVNAACEAVIVAEQENETEMSDDDNSTDARSESSLCWGAASDDSNYLEEDFISDPVVAEHATYIKLFTDQLSGIALAIRKPGSKYRFARIDADFDETSFGEFSKFLTTVILGGFEDSNAQNLTAKEKMKRTQDWTRLNEVQRRLVRLNLLRRHRIEAMTKSRGSSTRKHHERKLIPTAAESNSVIPQSEIPESLPGSLETSSAAARQASKRPDFPAKSRAPSGITDATKTGPDIDNRARPAFARKSWAETTGMIRFGPSQTFPSCPYQDEDGALTCPYCNDALPREYSEAKDKDSWDQHVMQDLIPYSCIAGQCTQGKEMFLTAEDLIDHMLTKHSVLRWICDYCTDINAEDGTVIDEKTFHTAEDWVNHVERNHGNLIAIENRNMHAEMNKRRLIGPLSCPLCGFTDDSLTSVINDHILCHLRQFALWALSERMDKLPVRITEALNLPDDVFDGSKYIRRANSRDSRHLAALEKEGSNLMLIDRQGIRLLCQNISDGDHKSMDAAIKTSITLAEQLARAQHILTWDRPDEKEKLEHDLRITFGTVKELKTHRTIEMNGNGFVLEDENIYISLENNSPSKTLYVSAFDINVAGKVAHISNGSPRGIELRPETDHCIGEDDFELEYPGISISWPESVFKTQSVTENLVFIITDQPVDLRYLDTEVSAGDRGEIGHWPSSPEQQTIAPATTTKSNMDANTQVGCLRYDILRIPFSIKPFTSEHQDSSEKNDRRQLMAQNFSLPKHSAQDHSRPAWQRKGSRTHGVGVKPQDHAANAIKTMQLMSEGRPRIQLWDIGADRTGTVDSLASSLLQRYMQNHDLDDINEAIKLWTNEIMIGPRSRRRLERLGKCFSERARVLNSAMDLDRAVKLTEEAIEGTNSAHQDYPDLMMSLAKRLHLRFSRFKSINDIDRAVHAAEASASMTPIDHQLRPVRLKIHGTMLCERSERTGSIHDLRCAIDVLKIGLEDSPADHPVVLSLRGGLGRCFANLYEYTGSLEHLEESIRCLSEYAAGILPEQSELIGYLNLLGCQLSKRYEHTGSMSDINKAIRTVEEAMEMLREHDLLRCTLMINVSTFMVLRYDRTASVGDLESAIATTTRALEATPPGQAAYAARFSNLGELLSRRFEKLGTMKDLNMSNRLLRRAVELLPRNDIRSPMRMNNLACGLFTRYLMFESTDDLDEAIKILNRATQFISEDHPWRSMVFGNLVKFYYKRGRHTLDDQMRCSLESWKSRNSPPLIRIDMAYIAAGILSHNGRYEESSLVLESAISLLPLTRLRALKGNDQQHILQRVSGLTSLAAATALQTGKPPFHAARLLETGHGILAALACETPTEIDDLKQSFPQLANEFVSLRDKLNSPYSVASSQVTEEDTGSLAIYTRKRNELESRFNEVVAGIRTKPGFEDFLLPPKAEAMYSAALSGPIVVLNATFWRCDAIIIHRGEIKLLPLPRFGPVNSQGEIQFSTHSLENIWDVIARPVLDHLGFLQRPENGKLPHIWWVLTRGLSRLPIHAAGHHYEGSYETMLDCAISSYSTSIKALLRSRQNSDRNIRRRTSPTACLISMPSTPSHESLQPSYLEFAEQETRILRRVISPTIPATLLFEPEKGEVLRHLQSCTAFHFAGHSFANSSDPSKSSLLLRDWANNPLTIENLTSLKPFENTPWLAYLSARSIGDSEAEKPQKESIHLLSACQSAGLPHVVGSLWTLDGECSAEAALEVYRTILEHGWTDESVALGVHNAATYLRKKTTGEMWAQRLKLLDSRHLNVLSYGKNNISEQKDELTGPTEFGDDAVRSSGDPSIWAAYIHIGP